MFKPASIKIIYIYINKNVFPINLIYLMRGHSMFKNNRNNNFIVHQSYAKYLNT